MFELSQTQHNLQNAAKRLARDKIRLRAAEVDLTEEYPWDNVALLKEAGFMGMTIPKKYGGQGASYLDVVLVVEEMAKVCGVTGRITVEGNMADIYGLIDEIAAAEKITRKKLSILSRDILLYVMESHDIDSVNRLLGVLTPMNKRAAILYFGHFLPWTQEKDKQDVFQRFGKMVKGERKVKAKADAITEWQSDPF